MRIGSLFSGAGGLDCAVQAVFGGDVAWHSEIDKAASKVLAHRFPGVPNLGSVTDIDWMTVEPVGIICGGFPCTDVSAAGKRAGMHSTRSGLWSHMAEAIDVLRPRFVVIENVRGLLNANANRPLESEEDDLGDGSGGPVLRAIGAVLGDLADIGGYEARWVTLAAASVGAPHRRERVFILASLADAPRNGRDEGRPESAGFVGGSDVAVSRDGDVALLPTPTTQDGANCAGPSQFQRNTLPLNAEVMLLPTPAAADGQRGQDFARADRDGSGGDDLVTIAVKADRDNQWGKYAAAIARWEQIVGPAPAPTEPNKNGNPRLSAAFSQWLMGWPPGWVTDPALGISRNEQLRCIGNGVVTAQAEAAIRYLLSMSEVSA